MTAPSCSLIAQHGLPVVVLQALDDVGLPPMARLMMWHLRLRLDLVEFREVYVESIAKEMRIEDQSAGRLLRTLVETGYLEMHTKRRPRAYRFFWSRRTSSARAA